MKARHYSQTLSAKMQSYLLWLQERGLPTVSPQLLQKPVEEAKEANLTILGPRPAKVLVFFDGQQSLQPEEKALVRKMLEAIDLHISKEVCFVQAAGSATVVTPHQLQGVVNEIQPQAIVLIGGAKLSWLGEAQEKNIVCYPTVFAGALPLLPLQHPRDILDNVQLKRGTWVGLKSLKETLATRL